MTEKRKPHYRLADIQRNLGTLTIWKSAIDGALAMGLQRAEINEVIASLTHRDFYKSMTTYHDHRVWMDVYHGQYEGTEIYIKFVEEKVVEFALTSFKKRFS